LPKTFVFDSFRHDSTCASSLRYLFSLLFNFQGPKPSLRNSRDFFEVVTLFSFMQNLRKFCSPFKLRFLCRNPSSAADSFIILSH
ncbi:MAG: hypothetical protein PHV95_08785, partial [Eubacteriales bacterium]|nr:hypothetical protein [Eubacteriales bacterium]